MRMLIALFCLASLATLHAHEVGGMVTSDTEWTASHGPILVTAKLTVVSNVTLTISAGTEVAIASGTSIQIEGHINIAGRADAAVIVRGATPTNQWETLRSSGTNSSMSIRFADVSGGNIHFGAGSVGLIEDSYIHDFNDGSTPIAGSQSALSVTVRRTHFKNYYETLWRETMMLIEDSLFEYASRINSDAIDFDIAPPGSAIRRCTFRHGSRQNTDAIDLGSRSRGVIVEDCLIYDFPSDKGISIGEDTFDVIIRNSLIYGCDTGIAVKDSCTATVYACTIVQNGYGIRNYNKADSSSTSGGGHITESYNNLLWGNELEVSLSNASTFVADHSLISNTNWPGDGNFDTVPSFLNAPEANFIVQPATPAATHGRAGTAVGARFPVGSAMAASHPSFSHVADPNEEFAVRFWMDSERDYTFRRGPTLEGPWEYVGLRTLLRPTSKTISLFPEMHDGAGFVQLYSTKRSDSPTPPLPTAD